MKPAVNAYNCKQHKQRRGDTKGASNEAGECAVRAREHEAAARMRMHARERRRQSLSSRTCRDANMAMDREPNDANFWHTSSPAPKAASDLAAAVALTRARSARKLQGISTGRTASNGATSRKACSGASTSHVVAPSDVREQRIGHLGLDGQHVAAQLPLLLPHGRGPRRADEERGEELGRPASPLY